MAGEWEPETNLREIRNETLARLLSAPGRCAVYGTGAAAAGVLGKLSRIGLKPHALLDADRTGELHGLEILAPEAALGGLDLVITASPFARDATARLRADGFEGAVIDLGSADRFRHHYDVTRIEAEAEAIAFARSLLMDDGSRHVFDSVLAHRRSLDPGELPPESPRGANAVGRDGERVLDVGGRDEEAVLETAQALGPHGHLHVFETDRGVRIALRDALAGSALGGRVTVHALEDGAGDPQKIALDDEDAPVSRTLDEFVRDSAAGRVDRIRLAAGPGQQAALDGAAAVIAERRPALVVALAHRPDDLWQLPIRIKEQVPAYRLHLAHHTQSLDGTVCYATPPG